MLKPYNGDLTTANSYFTINLKGIFDDSRTPLGLSHYPAFGLRVGAIDDDHAKSFSSAIIIIPTPITMANGKSDAGGDAGNGKVEVKWNSIAGVLGNTHNNG